MGEEEKEYGKNGVMRISCVCIFYVHTKQVYRNTTSFHNSKTRIVRPYYYIPRLFAITAAVVAVDALVFFKYELNLYNTPVLLNVCM